MDLPNDPVMLLSFINTKLRDEFENLDELIEFYNVDFDSINKKLNSINYFYDQNENQFK